MPRKRPTRAARSSKKPKASQPKRTRRASPRKPPVSEQAIQLARRIAETLPFVNFPARTVFPKFLHWKRLESGKDQERAQPAGDFERLRWGHVFAYAGPSCFRSNDSIGDAVSYFQPSLDTELSGAIAPFDSGSLEEPRPKLQPWAGQSLAERWRLLQKSTVSLEGWRAEFQRWLLHCYTAPERYLDSSADRYKAGVPDRTRPAAILQHNGPQGRERYGAGQCADRRAWTWEARFEQPVPFVRLQALHVARDRVQEALQEVGRLKLKANLSIEVEALPPGQDASADTLYEDSGRVLRKLMGL
ncbi:MAG TPA: hypothetical protein VEY88_13980 [Archangium sp.]|nr:hypothetical protein [Archangium sp.]